MPPAPPCTTASMLHPQHTNKYIYVCICICICIMCRNDTSVLQLTIVIFIIIMAPIKLPSTVVHHSECTLITIIMHYQHFIIIPPFITLTIVLIINIISHTFFINAFLIILNLTTIIIDTVVDDHNFHRSFQWKRIGWLPCVTFNFLLTLQKEEDHEVIQSFVWSGQIHSLCRSLWYRGTR